MVSHSSPEEEDAAAQHEAGSDAQALELEAPTLEAANPGAEGPALYLVATPIGNLADISARALEVLQSCSLVACEDTRHSGRLLSAHGIRAKLLSLTEHNETQRSAQILGWLREGHRIALVSDAGMPTISDPGQRLVQSVVAAGLRVVPVPGANAVMAALSASGLPTVPFYFGGFLAHRKGQRDKELQAAIARDCTSLYFESPFRLVDSLGMIAATAPEHKVVVARELTKKFEEFTRGSAQQVLEHYRTHTPRGEITLLIAPAELPRWMQW